MSGTARIVFKGNPKFGGRPVTCPQSGSGPNWGTTVIQMYVTMAGVMGSCGRTHRTQADYELPQSAECIFQVEDVTKEELQALAAPGKTGRVRGKLPTGKTVDVQIISFGAPSAGAQAGGGKAAQAYAQAKGGKGQTAPQRAPRGGGGAAAAFFNAVAATATAAGTVAGSAASIVGSAADLGKEGVGLARDGVREAGAYGGRRHERKMAKGDDGGSEGE
ncbi:hypothetical protein [Streptomyces sp. NPDC002530]